VSALHVETGQADEPSSPNGNAGDMQELQCQDHALRLIAVPSLARSICPILIYDTICSAQLGREVGRSSHKNGINAGPVELAGREALVKHYLTIRYHLHMDHSCITFVLSN
jgi:hypothetical protein